MNKKEKAAYVKGRKRGLVQNRAEHRQQIDELMRTVRVLQAGLERIVFMRHLHDIMLPHMMADKAKQTLLDTLHEGFGRDFLEDK